MDISLKKTIEIGALRLAISPNKRYIAASSERCVRILSVPSLKILWKLPISHTVSMVFSDDSKMLIATTTTGEIYRWSADGSEMLGKWPKELWYEGPIFYCNDGCIALACRNSISVFNIHTKEFRSILNCALKTPLIAGILGDKIAIIIIDDSSVRQEIVTQWISTKGDILSTCRASEKVVLRQYSLPILLSNGTIALLSAPSWFGKFGTISIFGPDGHMEKYDIIPKEYDVSGCRVASSEKYIAVAHEVCPHRVTIYVYNPCTYMSCIEEGILCGSLDINPPSDVLFLSENELLVGTWERLMLFSIE